MNRAKDKLTKIYEYAESKKIGVYSLKTQVVESMSVMDAEGKCDIAINPEKIKSTADEIVKLAHEIGHCECGAFYNEYSPLDIRAKHERRATEWAIRELIPRSKLIEAIKEGILTKNELAEHFEVTEELMQAAMEYYSDIVYKLQYLWS